MIVGTLTMDLHFPHSRSLKDKRRILQGFKARTRERYNVAVAEIDHQDKWQRAALAFVSVSGQASMVEETLQKVLRDAAELDETELAGWNISYV